MKLNVSEPLYVELFHDTFPGNEVVPLRTILGSLEQVQVKNFDLFESEDSKILHCGRILHHWDTSECHEYLLLDLASIIDAYINEIFLLSDNIVYD